MPSDKQAMKIALLGEEVLRQSAQAVEDFSDAELAAFIAKLKQTMLAAGGIGIAAPQVFDPRAVMIIASKANERYPDAPDMLPVVMINPKIISCSPEMEKDWEGCLSVPKLRGLVPRHRQVTFSYQDEQGTEHRLSWQGFLARIFQHEYDHLTGKTWLDRVESMADVVAEEVYFSRLKANR
ncbi:peptide deformylase [Thalassomonas sp. RHCl1]|uniref:peptide deformylase n=1 Tax=Thalassomonas sp. RHCl1 TaxID=2995320 RepID=UPI00248AC154|nr:peptide deformylase [Thalassomonas sp. RHCl1]